MSVVEFEYPNVLWGLWGILPLFVLLSLRSRAEVSKSGRVASLLVRAAWATLCIVALATPTLRRQHPISLPSKIVLLHDMSGSVASDRDEAARKIENLRRLLGKDTDFAEICFAGRTWRPEETPGDGNETDIAGALDTVSAQNQDIGDLRVVLLSDGRATRGSAEAAAERLGLRGGRVYAMPIGQPQDMGLKIERVEPPVDAHVGVPQTMRVTVSCNQAVPAAVNLKDAQGKLIDHRSLPLVGQKTVILHLTPMDAGIVTYEVSVEPQKDAAPLKSDRAPVSMHVGSPPRILISDCFPDEIQPLRRALDPLKTPFDVISPDDWPEDLTPYAAIVISDWTGKELTDAQRVALRGYVEEFGGGLLFVGGGNVMPKQWKTNPLAEVLPIELKEKPSDIIKRQEDLSVEFVIDRSGSMSQQLPSPTGLNLTKMDAVKAAVESTVAGLPAYAQVSIVVFGMDPQELLPPTRADKREEINKAIDGLTASGENSLKPAILAGLATLEKLHGDKYVVVLTDGIDLQPATNATYWAPCADEARSHGISWTSIAVGADADQALLQYLAEEARGKYYFCDTADSIPQVFLKQAMAMKRVVERKEMPFKPRGGPMADQLKDIALADLPELSGRVHASARTGVDTVLVAENDEPLLATWQFGLGRVSAFASDAKGGWGKQWIGWKEYGPFWLQQVQAIMRTNPLLNTHVKSKMAGNVATFDFTVTDQLGHAVDNMNCQGTLTATKEVQENPTALQWKQLGPGEYQASMQVQANGNAYLATMNLDGRDGQNVKYYAQVSAKPTLEMSLTGADAGMLSAIAAAGKGFCSNVPDEIAGDCGNRTVRTVWQSIALWPYLVIAAMLLWPIDLLVRKLM